MQTARVRYQLAVSLDGWIGPEDGSVDWLAPYDEVGEAVMGPFMEQVGGLVMGRRTLETLLRLGDWPFGHLPTCVLSSNAELELPPGFERAATPAAALAAVRARLDAGDIWLVGGGRTAAAMLAEGLLDSVELTVVPVVLGGGEALFGGLATPASLTLESTRPGPQGTVVSIYRCGGERCT